MNTAELLAHKMQEWVVRTESIAGRAVALDLHIDAGTIIGRIERDATKRRALEPGCAYRLIRFATMAREAGHSDLGQEAYALAAEVIEVELRPSPDWATMCAEEGWP